MAFPGTYNFNYYCGDSYEFTISPKNSSGTEFDLTNYTGIFSIATARGDSEAIVLTSIPPDEETPGDLSIEIDEESGVITCKILPESGATLSGTYVYDVEITNVADNKVYTLLTGTITVTQDVQRVS